MNPTTDSAIPGQGSAAAAPETNHAPVVAISAVATTGDSLFGFDRRVIDGTVDGLQPAFNANLRVAKLPVASMLLGSSAGVFFAGRLANLGITLSSPTLTVSIQFPCADGIRTDFGDGPWS